MLSETASESESAAASPVPPIPLRGQNIVTYPSVHLGVLRGQQSCSREIATDTLLKALNRSVDRTMMGFSRSAE
jgi:hypothetical protein